MGILESFSSAWYEFWPDIRKPIPVKGFWYGAPCIPPDSQPTFDPMLGFPNGRKERKMHMTMDEMIDARIPPEHRTYCAHKYLDFMKCYEENGTLKRVLTSACQPVWHHYAECRYNLLVMQFKEYERERRLLARQKRRIAKGLEPDPNAVDNAETM